MRLNGYKKTKLNNQRLTEYRITAAVRETVIAQLGAYHQWPLTQRLADISKKTFKAIAEQLNQWQIKPNGTEGRTAEVTLGGVNVDEVSPNYAK